MGHSVRIVCFTLLAAVSYARCLFDGEEFFAERGVSSSSLKVSRREGSSPRLWHVDLCHVFDAPPSCGANQRANLFELGSTDSDCRGAYVAAGDVWSRVTLPSLGVALTNFFVDATRNDTLYVLLQCGQETKLHARSDVNTAAVSRALHGAQWLALTSPNLPSKLCGRLNTTTTPGKPTRPTTSTLPPATSSSPAASSTTALTPTTVPIPTTGAPPAACYVSNGDAFTLPFVTIPFSSYNPYNTTYMGVNFWTFSLCEPTTITPGCPSTVPAYIFDSAGVGQAENQIGPCLNAYWARDSTYWEYMGPGRLQKIFTALDDSGLSVNVTLLCGPSPLLEPYSNNNNGNEWSVNTTDQTWMITLLTSNVPGCPAATPPPVVTDCELMYLESETININVTDPDGAVVPTTWSYNLCTPKTYAEQCGGDNSNTSQLPVFIWLHSRNGTGCEIAFTYQEPWQQLNAIFLLTLYSIDMRFVINMTIVPGVMTPLFPLTLTWPTVMVDEGRKTMFNMLLSSTAAGQPLTYCQAVDNTYFSLPWINVSVPVSAQPGTPPRQQFWVISPCGPIQNPYCSGTQTVDYVTQQVGPSRESRCGSVFVPVMEFGPDPWQFLRGKNNAGFFSVFNNTFNVPLNITIRCCANCTVLEVDPAGPQWTDSAIFLASNALPDTVCNSPTTTPAPFTPPPGAACTYEGGSTFTLPPFSGTYPTYYLGESQPVMETWTFQLCGLSQPPTCVESSPISVLWNTECVQQYQMDFPDWIFTGNGVGAHFASNIARVHVNVSCGGSSELALTNTEIMQDLGADGEPVFKLHFTSNLLPSTVCDVRPPAPPGPGAFCPGTNAYLPKLSVQWPLFVPNSEHPVVQKLWNISLCTLQVSLGCAHLAPTNFILSMDDTDESDCQVAFVTQTQPWSATSYLGYSGISAVFTNAAGSRLATVTVVSAGSSPLQPFSPQGLGGWPVTKLADSYSWDLYFYSNAL